MPMTMTEFRCLLTADFKAAAIPYTPGPLLGSVTSAPGHQNTFDESPAADLPAILLSAFKNRIVPCSLDSKQLPAYMPVGMGFSSKSASSVRGRKLPSGTSADF